MNKFGKARRGTEKEKRATLDLCFFFLFVCLPLCNDEGKKNSRDPRFWENKAERVGGGFVGGDGAGYHPRWRQHYQEEGSVFVQATLAKS